jgi:dCTP diphosphatase
MSDASTTVAELRRAVAEFVDARDWRQFHNPKNLAMSIAIEAAELMEHFQWLDLPESGRIDESSDAKREIREELADVLCYVLSLANALEIDVSSALRDKLVKNAAKYPAERFRGRFK